MKKVIAAAAGLMLVGAMVGSASAAVSFSGDARARGLYQTNYDLGEIVDVENEDGVVTGVRRSNEKDNLFNSRVRLQARGEAAGGAYAIGRMDIGSGTWDNGNSGTAEVNASKAYFGIPMGMTLLEAGRQPTQGLETTKFYEHDITRDGVRLFIMPSDMATIELSYYQLVEAAVNGDNVDDNDDQLFAAWVDAKFAGDWGTRLGILYRNDQIVTEGRDDDGAFGGIEIMGPAGPVAVQAAFAFDDQGEGDTGYGGFLQGGMQFGATGVALNVGFANDGFVTDGDFGFIMLGGGQSISVNTSARGRTDLRFGAQGDTWWIGLPVTFAVSEQLTLGANFAYADMDTYGDGWELSGTLGYAISDGASLDFDIGYFGYSRGDTGPINEESPFGAGLTFEVKF